MSNRGIFTRLVSCAIALLLAACSHKSETPHSSSGANNEASSPDQSLQPASAPQAAPLSRAHVAPPAPIQTAPQLTVANPAIDPAAMLGPLTQALREYSAEKQRVPPSFSDVVAAGYMQAMPSPPPGKKFSINPKRVEVILVNQ